jgi:multidrug efflux pump subunit AcrA (membrane-fusion protein)
LKAGINLNVININNMKNIFLSLFIILNALVSCNEISIQTKPVRKDMTDLVYAIGKLIPEIEYNIPSMLDGNIKQLYINEGDSIKLGQPVCQIGNELQLTQMENAATNYNFSKNNAQENAPQIIKLKEQINQALTKSITDSLNVIRYQRLFEKHAVSGLDLEKTKVEFLNSQTNRTVLQKSMEDLKSIMSLNESNAKTQLKIQEQNFNYSKIKNENTEGIILKIFKTPGDLVRKGEPICRISSGRTIVRLMVSAGDLKSIFLNQPILISLITDNTNLYKGEIIKIHPMIDENSQSYIVDASLQPTANSLPLGSKVQVNILIKDVKDALVIPSNYLLEGDSVSLANNHQKVAVKTGIKTEDFIQILSGINENNAIELIDQ